MNFIQLIHISHLFYTSYYYRSGSFVLGLIKLLTIVIFVLELIYFLHNKSKYTHLVATFGLKVRCWCLKLFITVKFHSILRCLITWQIKRHIRIFNEKCHKLTAWKTPTFVARSFWNAETYVGASFVLKEFKIIRYFEQGIQNFSEVPI